MQVTLTGVRQNRSVVVDDYLKAESKIELKESSEPDDSGVLPIAVLPSAVIPLGLPPQYEILEELGKGGMGTVYKARHRQLGTYVAIKVINPNLLEGKNETKEIAQKRFVNEAKAVSQLQFENLITLKEFGVTPEGAAFMVMEYAEGKTLEALVKLGPMDYKSVLNIMRGVCDGLEHAHTLGLVHRDIKPGNIIVTKTAAGREVPKLLDFGIARITGDDGKTQGLTSTGDLFGSPYYIAPEQSLSSKVDSRADIYSLGCVLFECVTGKPPFKGETAMQTIMMHLNAPIPSASAVLGKSLPPDLEYIIQRCLQKQPAKRYQSAAALKTDIDLLLAGKPVKRSGINAGAASKNKRGLLIVIAGALAIMALALVFALNLSNTSGGGDGIGLKGLNGNLESAAYNVDVGESYTAFVRGDYNKCIILQKGAIGVYDDKLDSIAADIAKGASGADLKKLDSAQNRLFQLKAENLKHVGDCYRLMGQDAQALNYYQKGHEIFQRWAFTGYRNTDMDECYRYTIMILNKLGRADDARNLQTEFDRSLHSRQRS